MFNVIETTYEATLGKFDYQIIVKKDRVWIKRKPIDMSWFTLPCIGIWTGFKFASVVGDTAKFADAGTLEHAIEICKAQAD